MGFASDDAPAGACRTDGSTFAIGRRRIATSLVVRLSFRFPAQPPAASDFLPRTIGTMNVSDFSFDLPAELIAQAPAVERGASRLLVLHKGTGQVEHAHVSDLARFLREGDLLVVNDTQSLSGPASGRASAERWRCRVPSAGRSRRRTLGCARPSRAEAPARLRSPVPRHHACAATVRFSSGISTAVARSASGLKTVRASRRPSTTSATYRCRRISSARIRPAIASAIRRSMPASAARWRRRRRAFISRRKSSRR